jgi:hypothetical protein
MSYTPKDKYKSGVTIKPEYTGLIRQIGGRSTGSVSSNVLAVKACQLGQRGRDQKEGKS